MNILEKLLSKINNPNKEWIVYDIVNKRYSVMNTQRKERVERDFWDFTHRWRVFRWTQELEDKLIKTR